MESGDVKRNSSGSDIINNKGVNALWKCRFGCWEKNTKGDMLGE